MDLKIVGIIKPNTEVAPLLLSSGVPMIIVS